MWKKVTMLKKYIVLSIETFKLEEMAMSHMPEFEDIFCPSHAFLTMSKTSKWLYFVKNTCP